jgi:hypothetical protein
MKINNILNSNNQTIMNNKNQTLLVVLLTIIATTLVLGVIYLSLIQKTPETESLITSEPAVEKQLPTTEPTTVSKEVEEEIKPVFESGETVLINENYKPWKCSLNGDPCEKVLVTTEILLTEASMGNKLTGRFFIRAYNGADYRNSPKIGELQITQNFNPFSGDGGGIPFEKEREEILTIKAYEKPPVFSESELKDRFNLVLEFKDKFYLEYMDSVPGWDMPGYVLRIANEDKASDFNGRFIDFYYSNGVLDINVPQ